MKKKAIVRYTEDTNAVPCPYGDVKRVITGGEGSANVHIVSVTKGKEHVHRAYEETYYVLSGTGTICLDGETWEIRPGAVVYIPAQMPHSLESTSPDPLVFIIFGTPPMSIDDDRARPRSKQ
nr:cupin domain-containing protein [uncultured Desulfobacter sp.]